MESRKIQQVEDMPVYQLFYKLTLEVEEVTRHYGPDFRCLRGQSLRSSESVCANMTEGFYSQYSTEYLQSLYRCRREAHEVMTHIRYARDVRQLPAEKADALIAHYMDGCQQINNLIASIERKARLRGKSKPSFSGVKEELDSYEAVHEPLTINH